MEDLNYIISLGFSGADIPRALIISFFIAMMFAPQNTMWRLGFVALAVDKLAWPIVAQAAAGAGMETLFESLKAIVISVPDDLGVYLVRYFGLTVLIGLFAAARARIHMLAPAKKAAA